MNLLLKTIDAAWQNSLNIFSYSWIGVTQFDLIYWWQYLKGMWYMTVLLILLQLFASSQRVDPRPSSCLPITKPIKCQQFSHWDLLRPGCWFIMLDTNLIVPRIPVTLRTFVPHQIRFSHGQFFLVRYIRNYFPRICSYFHNYVER